MFRAWVKDPVVDLRREPVSHNGKYWQDPLQETQVLKGEELLVYEIQGDWARVGVVGQPCFREKWQAYPGWLPRASFQDEPIGPEQFSAGGASSVLSFARQFLGSPYLWGGRSPYPTPGLISGVDCSSLVHLAYGAIGLILPRDAHDQYMICHPLQSGQQVETADLIFFEPMKGRGRVDHVMLFAGGDQILEATMDVGFVREVSGVVRFGRPVRQILQGQECGSYRVFFGRCRDLADSEKSAYYTHEASP